MMRTTNFVLKAQSDTADRSRNKLKKFLLKNPLIQKNRIQTLQMAVIFTFKSIKYKEIAIVIVIKHV